MIINKLIWSFIRVCNDQIQNSSLFKKCYNISYATSGWSDGTIWPAP